MVFRWLSKLKTGSVYFLMGIIIQTRDGELNIDHVLGNKIGDGR